MLELVTAILASTIDYAPPLVLAALGGVVCERAGVVNIALEGLMRLGAFFASAGALWTGSPWLGLALGVGASMAAAAVHGALAVHLRSDQIVSGIAVNLLALGGVTFLAESWFGKPDTDPTARLPLIHLPFLADLPVLSAFSGRSALAYLALALPLAAHAVLFETPIGLRIRAAGENPLAAETAGVRVGRLRFGCVLLSGLLAGWGGASLSISILDHFNHHLPAGQGFIALAAVVFGNWKPLGAFAAACFFAAASALQTSLPGSFPTLADLIPKGFFAALPYLLTLLLLAGFVGRARPPTSLGIPYDPESR